MSDNPDPGAAPAPAAAPSPGCFCMGLGPELSRLVRRFALSDDAWQQLHAAELELLKTVRALIDERIHALSHEPERGTRMNVE